MIEVKNLTFTYPGNEEPVLKGLDFAIPRGTIFGFLGPSGAGKSTTQKILMGLLRGYGGQVSYEGKELNPKEEGFYSRLGVAFDVPRFYGKMTGRENLRFFASLYGERTPPVDELLEAVELTEGADRKVQAYSKGMVIRLNLCRALMHDPPILFLDEPTSGLDPGLARKVRELIAEQRTRGKTIFLTTHSMETADELCDSVAFLAKGKIALCDAPVNIRNRNREKDVVLTWGKEGSYQEEALPLKGIHKNPRFLSLMEGGDVRSLHSRETTLEDMFIALTGQSLGEGERL
ncbi:MAG: ABC transporter ATP-binding protein [Spirochaetales bacterium]|nr:ABC transporter ATP-binding protein [Spirochaetales bacterium]